MLASSIFEERMPVWAALSNLFLDTELTENDIQHVAKVLRDSPYELRELERILRNEVTLAFRFNLLSIAGEWAGFTEEAVREIMTRSLERGQRFEWLPRFLKLDPWGMIQEDWQRVASLLA